MHRSIISNGLQYQKNNILCNLCLMEQKPFHITDKCFNYGVVTSTLLSIYSFLNKAITN